MTSVQRGGSISCFATSFKGLSCLVSFVDSPSERVPLVVGWVSLVTHLREHTVPSPFLLNNVNGARHVRGATGGTETQKQSHTRRQKGSPMQTFTHTNTCKCTQTDQHTHPTGHSNPLSAGDTYFSPQREKGKDAGNFACVFAWMSVSPGMKCTCGVQAWMPLCVCVCFPHVSILYLCMSVHPSNSSVPIPAETSALHVPPHTGRMPSRFVQLRQTTLPIRGPRDNVKSRSQLKWMGKPVQAG